MAQRRSSSTSNRHCHWDTGEPLIVPDREPLRAVPRRRAFTFSITGQGVGHPGAFSWMTCGPRRPLAFRAMPVAARIVGDADQATRLTGYDGD
jgi:hypothetical protein